MAPKMFDEFNSFIVLFLPKFQMTILAGGYYEIFPAKNNIYLFNSIVKTNSVAITCVIVSLCMNDFSYWVALGIARK
jgi:hypothetical protein